MPRTGGRPLGTDSGTLQAAGCVPMLFQELFREVDSARGFRSSGRRRSWTLGWGNMGNHTGR
eukprot:15212206-Alexandrium_andersonii.AAC.1